VFAPDEISETLAPEVIATFEVREITGKGFTVTAKTLE
jgi:hypothetical protein